MWPGGSRVERRPVIDADGHIIESDQAIFEYLPPPYAGQDPDAAVRELERAVTKLGMVGAILPAVGLQRAFGAREFWPIYQTAQDLDVLLAVHGAPSHNLGLERFQRLIEVRTLTHPFSQMIQLTSMMF